MRRCEGLPGGGSGAAAAQLAVRRVPAVGSSALPARVCCRCQYQRTLKVHPRGQSHTVYLDTLTR